MTSDGRVAALPLAVGPSDDEAHLRHGRAPASGDRPADGARRRPASQTARRRPGRAREERSRCPGAAIVASLLRSMTNRPDRTRARRRIEIIDEGRDPRDDNRRAAGHRLEHAEAKALLDRSEDKRGRQAVERRHVAIGDGAEQRTDGGPFAQLCQFAAESRLIGMMIEQARAARNDEARVRVGAMDLDKSLKDADRVLALLNAADERNTGPVPSPRRCLSSASRSVGMRLNSGTYRRRCRRRRLRGRSAR